MLMAQSYDNIFKQQLQRFLPKNLQVFLGDEYRQIKNLPTEMSKTMKRTADFLYQVSTDDDTFLLQVEVQTKNDARMPARMLTYAALLHEKYGRSIKQVVLYIGKQKMNMASEIRMPYFAFRYEIIDFRRMDYRHLLQSNQPEKIIFAILGDFGQESQEQAVRQIVAKLGKSVRDRRELDDLAEQLQILSQLRNLGAIVEQNIAAMLDIKIKETPFFRKGKTEGIREGKQEGKLEANQAVARLMLKNGEPVEKRAAYTGFSAAQVEQLSAGLRGEK